MSLKPALFCALLATPVLAQDPQPLSYEVFEAAIPHVDLDQCPQDLPQQQAFCRATVKHGELHVFAFSEKDNSPMIGFATYPVAALNTQLN